MVSERRPELRHHIDDVALLARGVGRRLGLRAHELHEAVRAAELHDIGKMAIPDALLSKPGPLDAAEWEFMRQHTVIGERMLHMAPALEGVARLVRWSHERIDGAGYPDGLAGDEIPLGARIVAVCDAFGAMTSDRPYRTAGSADEAVAELLRHAGTQFDPEVVAAFQAELAEAHERPAIAVPSDQRVLSISAN
jgi:HD-GYP domain-containing protein (c-di-GMP phosphodiesterase class II)